MADMSSLVEVTSKIKLSNMYYWERLIRSEFASALDYSSRSKYKISEKHSQILTWLDLSSFNGYKREKTLRTLSGAAPNSFFFALAIQRLNDWVPQVREAANEKLPLIAKESNPVHVVEALCITLCNWNSWRRIGAQGKQALLSILTNNKNIVEALKSKLISSATGPMATVLTQTCRTTVLDKYLIEIAENAVQPWVRANAYRILFKGKLAWEDVYEWVWTDLRKVKGYFNIINSERKLTLVPPFLEILRKSSVDRSSVVRRVAAEFLIREFTTLGKESSQFAKLFASDKSPTVAERGRFVLKKLEESQA